MQQRRLAKVALLPSCFILITAQLATAQTTRIYSFLSTPRVTQDTWVRAAPADEEFTVKLPRQPKIGIERLTINEKTVDIRFYGLAADGVDYAVLSVSGLESEMADLAYTLMLNFYAKLVPASPLDDVVGNVNTVEATYQRDLTLNGHNGREYIIRIRNRSGMLRFFNAGERFYIAVASGTHNSSPLVNRFLNSFRLASVTPIDLGAIQVQPEGDTTGQRALPTPSSNEAWFVILRTFSKSEHVKANQHLSLIRRSGVDARIVDTNDYPNLKNGLLAVVMGPYSFVAAKNVLNKVRPAVPEAYIKSGR
ncbi:MAG: hypothetical protein H0T45_15245 [Pyrinomonadaceae bacterium]|nr:hypothetical protein [Pyrinomonadaceae bacterium]